jgi:uncharacterized protein YegL
MNSSNLVQHSLTGQHYGYSAANMGDLGASEYTLVTICCDESGSVSSYQTEIEKCIKEVINACKFSPRSDYLLIRLVAFNDTMREIHGFKQLVDCDLASYDNVLNPCGATSLFASAQNAITATNDYGKQLSSNDFDVNAIVFIITDGMDNASGNIDSTKVKEALMEVMKEEALESIMSILVGVGVGGYSDIAAYLDDFNKEAGLNQYIEIDKADEKTLAKLADFISKSVSSQSNSLGTGSMSQPLTF